MKIYENLTIKDSIGKIQHFSFYETDGENSIPLIFVHAFPLSKEMYLDQVRFLDENSVCSYFLDLPGFGNLSSLAVLPTPFTMEHYAAYIVSFMDFMKIPKAIIGGVSMGGYITLSFAQNYPKRLSGLVLVDTRAEPDSEEARKNRETTARKVETEGIQTIISGLVPKLVNEHSLVRHSHLKERIIHMIQQASPQGIANALRGMALRPDYRPHLPKIEVPTFIAVGENDELTPPSMSEDMHKLIPNSVLEIIPEVGHLSNLENPKLFNELLYSFVKDLIK